MKCSQGKSSSFSIYTTRTIIGLACATLSAMSSAQSYYRRDLPDYDQRRNALPGNGSMYCVPTSYADILRFMATKSGFTKLDASFNGGYGDITVFIYQLGLLMGTDSEGGTNFGDGVDAIEEWIDDHSSQSFDHTTFMPGNNWGTQRLRHTMAMGWMARIGISFYYKQGSGSTWERDGGHAVALAGYDYRTADKKIIAANPWTGSDDSINAQSTTGLGTRTVVNTPINTDDHGNVTHAMWKKFTDGGKRWEYMVDKMHVINPKWAGWVNAPFTTTPPLMASISGESGFIPFGATTFHAVFPQQMEDGNNPVVRERDVVLPGPVKDWCVDPGQAAIYVLLEDGTIHHVDLLDSATEPVTTIRGARKLAVAGKKFELFVLQDGDKQDNLVRFNIDSKVKTTMKIAKGITALEPDQETRGVAALHPTSKRLFRIDPELKAARPQAVELPSGAGQVLMNVGRKGEITLVRNGGGGFTRAKAGASFRNFTFAGAGKARAIQSLGRDRFLVQDGERLMTVNSEGKALSSAFDKIQATGVVRLSHGWKPFTRAEVSGPKWRDTPREDMDK